MMKMATKPLTTMVFVKFNKLLDFDLEILMQVIETFKQK